MIIPDKGWLGESWGFWVQTGALFASAIGALTLIWSSARSEKRRATVDLILEQSKDKQLFAARVFVKRQGQNLLQFLSDRDSDEYKFCLLVLNTYEFIAAAIREGGLDNSLFKRMQWTVVTRDWDALCPFVTELRRRDKHPTLFQEFERLALDWRKHPLVGDKPV